jgi:hypothetical protein
VFDFGDPVRPDRHGGPAGRQAGREEGFCHGN